MGGLLQALPAPTQAHPGPRVCPEALPEPETATRGGQAGSPPESPAVTRTGAQGGAHADIGQVVST